MEIKQIPIDKILIKDNFIYKQKLSLFIEKFKAGEAFPPIRVLPHRTKKGFYGLEDGYHRLEAQKLNGMTSVDAIIVDTTKIDSLARLINSMYTKQYYQPVLNQHPKLERFKYRIDVILHFCGEGSYLDVGSNVGYNCFEPARRGNQVVGIEIHKVPYNISLLLKKHYELDVEFINIKAEKYEPEEFDNTMILMLFHHMIKENKEQAFNFLNKVATKSKCVILQIRPKTWLPVKPEGIPNYIIDKSILNKYQQIGDVKKMPFGIPVYAFEK